ncbi:GIY-YIG nuclease family protein [Parasphingopyxis marina]|uniref:GIY-YIG nuclease family protein n=1 Tax=Parasphingopyxis marina TaxID=2761622 RepID=A0A842HRX4_9SPHN|nr:GIY-YIG nuclease family protein [Parasphingopyxis marina]MBC2776578.1 GIY-YIG nuclease family protein [Parasphingopyxis marina]
MNGTERKAAIAAYREREIATGVFALRFAGEARVWVGGAKEIAGTENRLRFSLRGGAYPRPALQRAWNAWGEAAFAFEILELLELEEDVTDFVRSARLASRLTHWREALAAEPI